MERGDDEKKRKTTSGLWTRVFRVFRHARSLFAPRSALKFFLKLREGELPGGGLGLGISNSRFRIRGATVPPTSGVDADEELFDDSNKRLDVLIRMDGLGYRNWGNNTKKKGTSYDDDSYSYEDSGSSGPPTYDSADPYAFSAEESPKYRKGAGTGGAGGGGVGKGGNRSGSLYDYSIEEDDEYDFSSTKKAATRSSSSSSSSGGGAATSANRDRFSGQSVGSGNNNNQRKSMEDRMKDILERNNAEKQKAAAETAAASKAAAAEDAEVDTWKSSWDDLLADMKITSPSGKDDEAAPADAKPAAAAAAPAAGAKGKAPGGRGRADDDLLDDDLDISAADLEVGTLAMRRAKEKADQVPLCSPLT